MILCSILLVFFGLEFFISLATFFVIQRSVFERYFISNHAEDPLPLKNTDLCRQNYGGGRGGIYMQFPLLCLTQLRTNWKMLHWLEKQELSLSLWPVLSYLAFFGDAQIWSSIYCTQHRSITYYFCSYMLWRNTDWKLYI